MSTVSIAAPHQRHHCSSLHSEVKRAPSMPYKYWVALFFTLSLFMDFLDGAIVNVAMPTFAREFSANTAEIQWVSTIFLLAIALCVLVSGWAGDRFGTKKVFLFATGLFTLGSLACAMADTLPGLIAARALQGVGGGIMGPVGSSMMMRAFPANERAKVSGLLMVPSMLAPVLAPSIGGYLVQYHGWGWIFGINVPVGLATVIAGTFVLRESPTSREEPLDLEGFFTSGVALMSLFYALDAASQNGTLDVRSGLILAVGVFAGALFLWRCARKASPLVDLRLFKEPLYRIGTGLQFLLIAGLNGTLFVFTLCAQNALGMSPLDTGLMTMVQAIATMAAMPLSGRYVEKVGHRRMVLIGISLYALSTLTMVGVLRNPIALMPLLALRGLGMGMCLVITWAAAFNRVADNRMGQATATMSAVIQLGSACGVAGAAAVLARMQLHAGQDAVTWMEPYRLVLGIFVFIALVAFGLGTTCKNSDAAHAATDKSGDALPGTPAPV